ncbi:MAG: D-alanine--D-alanine ligase family protein [bacterium]|nr:D-alanine--D-alanine ligase family protein [bacterium]
MKKVGLFFGGPSNEHEVSITSAVNVAKNTDAKKYEIVLVYWNKNGEFLIVPDMVSVEKGNKIMVEDFKKYFDVALPMTHGKYGEDGVLQAIFESQHLLYSGCHVLSSALCFDKAIFKDFISGHGIAQSKYIAIDYALNNPTETKEKLDLVKSFKLPVFVKPANSGSSVGIMKLDDFSNLDEAIKEARKHDEKVVIEEGFTNHKEIELAVLGNSELVISEPGEVVIPSGSFYDYDEKYKLGRAETKIPADVSPDEVGQIKKMAEKVYKLCGCSGFARVDMFVQNEKVYMNEINTLPGFTDISMYPKLMIHAGVSYEDLISKIIGLAY